MKMFSCKKNISRNIFKIVYKLFDIILGLRNITGILREVVLLTQEEEEFRKSTIGVLSTAIFSSAGCNGKGGQTTASQSEDFQIPSILQICRAQTTQFSNKNVDNENTANFVDGLLENDKYGNYVPALAESYELTVIRQNGHLRFVRVLNG